MNGHDEIVTTYLSRKNLEKASLFSASAAKARSDNLLVTSLCDGASL